MIIGIIDSQKTDPVYEDTILSIDLSDSEELSLYLNIFKEDDMLMTVDWGDGTTTTSTTQGSQDIQHTYNDIGQYDIIIQTNGNWYFDSYCLGTSDYNKYLMTANLSNSVTSIGTSAFYGCSSLTSINIPNSVTSIGGEAFRGCSSTTSITIPDSVTFIGNGAFYGCSSLTSINIPDSVTSIGGSAFYGCSSLTSINIPDSVTDIYPYTFRNCSNLTSITIPDSVTFIGSYAFLGCSSLTSINIPDSVTFIDDGAFNGCSSLTSITIPDSVTYIGLGIIDSTNLTDVYFAGTTETWVGRFGTTGRIFYDAGKTTVIVQCSNGDVKYVRG